MRRLVAVGLLLVVCLLEVGCCNHCQRCTTSSYPCCSPCAPTTALVPVRPPCNTCGIP